jgi:hypothetical protein
LWSRDSGVEKARHIQPIVSRDKAPRTKTHQFGAICTTPGNLTLPRVASEMALHVLAYNLTRVMNIIGIQPLMAAIKA